MPGHRAPWGRWILSPLLCSGLCSAWGRPCATTRAPCSCSTSLPTLLASSEMVIPLTRKVMTLIHYFKCHFCKGINQLSVRLDYILILIVLKSCCFLDTFFCSLNFSRAVPHLVSLYLAVISPLWKSDRWESLFSGQPCLCAFPLVPLSALGIMAEIGQWDPRVVLSFFGKCGDNPLKGTKEELNDKFSFIVK